MGKKCTISAQPHRRPFSARKSFRIGDLCSAAVKNKLCLVGRRVPFGPNRRELPQRNQKTFENATFSPRCVLAASLSTDTQKGLLCAMSQRVRNLLFALSCNKTLSDRHRFELFFSRAIEFFAQSFFYLKNMGGTVQ